MGISNNDFNWRLVAGEAIEENRCVTINSSGKAVKDDDGVVGIVPQPIASGERAPIIRGGTISGLTGMTAGQRLKPQADGSLGTAGAKAIVAVVKSEDATTAVILSGNLDNVS